MALYKGCLFPAVRCLSPNGSPSPKSLRPWRSSPLETRWTWKYLYFINGKWNGRYKIWLSSELHWLWFVLHIFTSMIFYREILRRLSFPITIRGIEKIISIKSGSEKATDEFILLPIFVYSCFVFKYTTAELCKLPYLGGWPSSFILQGFPRQCLSFWTYESILGILGTLFIVPWSLFVTNRPRECKRITVEEIAHIDGIGLRKRAATVIIRTPYKQVVSYTICWG